MKTEKEVIEHNATIADGSGIRYGLATTLIAKCHAGKHALRTGLGSFGVGQMWSFPTDEERADPDFASLPVEQCPGIGFIGEYDKCP